MEFCHHCKIVRSVASHWAVDMKENKENKSKMSLQQRVHLYFFPLISALIALLLWLCVQHRNVGIPPHDPTQLDHNQHSSENLKAPHSHPVQPGDAGITNPLPFWAVQKLSHSVSLRHTNEQTKGMRVGIQEMGVGGGNVFLIFFLSFGGLPFFPQYVL